MASEIRVDKINSLSGVGTVSLSPTGVDISGITTAATLRATTGIVTSLTAGSLTSLGAVSGTRGTFSGAVSGTTGTFTGDVDIADTIVHTGDTNTKIRFPAADTVTVETGGSERARITSAGLVGIATATPRAQFDVIKSSGNVMALFEGSNAAQNHRVRIDASAASSTTGLSISNSNSNNQTSLYHSGGNNNMVIMGGQTAGAEPTAGTAIATFASGGDVTVNTGNLVIGTSGKGIDFSATSDGSGSNSSELFDDYEEGSWTASMVGGNTMTTNAAYYTKIGRMVYWMLHCQPTFAQNNTTDYQIYGLPYQSANVTQNYGWSANITYTASSNNTVIANMRPLVQLNDTYIYFHTVGLGDSARVKNNLIRSAMLNQDFIIGGFYMTAT